MPEAVSRELILPAIRLDVPPRPSKQQVAAIAERTGEQWTTGPLDWAAQQVVRLAVARLLLARLEPAPGRSESHPVPTDPEQVTLAQLAGLFRPHVGLAAQAFELAVVEAVNSNVPAAVDPLREGLRRVGITGRDPLRIVALGLDKLPSRARPAFWEGVKGSSTLTAIVDALASGRGGERSHDVSGLDRSELSRADALVLAGGRITPITFTQRASEGRPSWVTTPLAVTRRTPQGEALRRGERGTAAVEVSLRGGAWTEVFETALDAVGSAMQQIDLGSRPRGRTSPLVDAVATRLVGARERTVAEVVASLRAIEPFALDLFDEQVTTTSVPVAVPAVEDDLFVQLWLPTSALAGPLFTGAPDLFLGGAPEYRSQGAKPGTRPADGAGGGRTAKKAAGQRGGQGRGQAQDGDGQAAPVPGQERPAREGGGRRGRRGRRPGGANAAGAPSESTTAPTTDPSTEPSAPVTGPEPTTGPVPAAAPDPAPAAPAPEPTPPPAAPADQSGGQPGQPSAPTTGSDPA